MATRTVRLNGANVELPEEVVQWLLKLHEQNEEKQRKLREIIKKAFEDLPSPLDV